ncbi:MAG: prenyltransferase [Aeromicrobium sp.]|uniref:prenyltransferase n=1 Tax=Aeromicrobium sp. TaxID=1871063 RepID=UPI0039E72807
MTPEQIAQTAGWIAAQAEESGALPWFAGGHLDPWDHVQAAMGLLVAGRRDEAERAYAWSRSAQRPDGSWAAKYEQGVVADDRPDANFTAYIAVGLWHHWLVTGDADFAGENWLMVEAAVEAARATQRPDGAFAWRPDEPIALVTGTASVAFSLRCAARLAGVVGADRPEWSAAADGAAEALRRPEIFEAKPHSMDWYYPLLGGQLPADEAERRLAEEWDTFVVPGLGVRCVTPNPWVTGAETCEFVLALDAYGRRDDALRIFADMQHLRDDDGSYWTGFEFETRERWPIERTTWTAATVLLAHDALHGVTGGSGLFRPMETA